MAEYDFGQLYGQADNSNLLYPEGWADGVIEDAEYGKSKDGTKGQWQITARVTTGEHAGKVPVKTTITISHDNPQALGIMFRDLAGLGIPVPDPQNPQVIVNGTAPFWQMGWSEAQVAQAMKGRPVLMNIKHDEYDGIVRNKIKGFRTARPGAPADWPRQQPQQPGYQQQQPPQGYPQAGYGQPPADPWAAQLQQPQQPYPGFQPGPAPQQPWNGGQQAPQPGPAYQGAPAAPAQGQQPAGYPAGPAAPPWAGQPAQPGAGSFSEFTQQGQSYQPGTTPWQPPQQPTAAPQQPWAGQPQPGQNPQAQPPAGPDGAPPIPPWAQ